MRARDAAPRAARLDAVAEDPVVAGRVARADGDGRVLVAAGVRRFIVYDNGCTDGTLAVLDAGNFRVQLFDQNGEFIREFGSAGTGPGNFSRPRGLAIDETGLLYVSDAKFNNFQVFNQEGELLMAIGGMKLRGGPGEYALLGRMGADELGHVFVTDLFFRKVEVYRRLSDEEGQALVARSNGT